MTVGRLLQPRELDAAVDRQRRRAGAALGAEEHQRRGLPACAGRDSRRAAVRRIAPWNVSSGGGQVKNSLAPARIACRIRSGSASTRDGEDAGIAGAPARSRSMVGIAADASPRASTMTRSGRSAVARASLVDDADRNRARPEEPPNAGPEGFVFADE